MGLAFGRYAYAKMGGFVVSVLAKHRRHIDSSSVGKIKLLFSNNYGVLMKKWLCFCILLHTFCLNSNNNE